MAAMSIPWGNSDQDDRRGSTTVREEWSEVATDAVVAAWGEKHVAIGRGKLKKHEWDEVAEKVSVRLGGGKSTKTWLQCKNKIDSVKKKYKIVLNQRAAGSLKKEWRLFDRVHELLGGLGGRGDGGGGMDSDGGEDDDDEMEGTEDSIFRQPGQAQVPPAPLLGQDTQRRTGAAAGVTPNGQGLTANNVAKGHMRKKREPPHSYHELALAIKEFGARYERVEMARQEKLVEVERMRMNFVKELELQRMQMQLDIAKLHGGGRQAHPVDQPIGLSPLMQPRQVPEGFTG